MGKQALIRRAKQLDSFWVVIDATEESTLQDVMWHVESMVKFGHLIEGSSNYAIEKEHWVIHDDEASAKADAEARLASPTRHYASFDTHAGLCEDGECEEESNEWCTDCGKAYCPSHPCACPDIMAAVENDFEGAILVLGAAATAEEMTVDELIANMKRKFEQGDDEVKKFIDRVKGEPVMHKRSFRHPAFTKTDLKGGRWTLDKESSQFLREETAKAERAYDRQGKAFKEGDRIVVATEFGYFPGKITAAVSSGIYDVKTDSGEEMRGLAAEDLFAEDGSDL